MYYRLIAAALPSLLVVSPTLAEDKPAPAPKPPREKKVCRSEEVVGSIIRQQTCKTPTQWKAIDDENQRTADDVMSRRNGGRGSSAGTER